MTRVVAVRHSRTDWNRNARTQGWAPTDLDETGREQAAVCGAWLAAEDDADRAAAADLLRTRRTADRLLDAVGEVPVEYDAAWLGRDLGVSQWLTYGGLEERVVGRRPATGCRGRSNGASHFRDVVRTRSVLTASGKSEISRNAERRQRRLSGHGEAATRFPEFGLGETADEAALAIPAGGESLRGMADRVTAGFDRLVERHPDETVLVVTHGGPLGVLAGYAKGMPLRAALGSHLQAHCAVNGIHVGGDVTRVVREHVTAWR
jgi:broad specificity phosphatase PhoE